MRRLPLLLTFLLSVLFTVSAAAQQVVLHVPSEYPTIQSAVNTAGTITSGQAPSDVLIEVSPGTYQESVDLASINNSTYVVTLRAVSGPAVTIIDPPKDGNHGLHGSYVQNFILDGFTVRNRYDPLEICCGAGLWLWDSTRITVRNSHFNTTYEAMVFKVRNPGISSEIYVVNNTAISGQGTDPNADDAMPGQAVDFTAQFSPNTWDQGPAAHSKLVVANNVLRSKFGSCVRYIFGSYSADGKVITGGFPKGTLTMTGNDVACEGAAGVNLIGGHGHLIAGNRIHDSDEGAQVLQMYGGRFENNLIVRNYNGLVFMDTDFVSGPMQQQRVVVDHNTIVNNLIGGIVYNTNGPQRRNVPVVTNNIVAFNDGGGLVAVYSDQVNPVMTYIAVDFQAVGNDVYGNTVRGLYKPNTFFTFSPITNPQLSNGNYGGVLNNGNNLSVVPGFRNSSSGDFSLNPNSLLVNASVGTPLMRDFAGNMRDSRPDIGAFEFVLTPNANVRSNPKSKRGGVRPE